MSPEPLWESTKVCSSAMPKAVTAASSDHDFWEVNPQWHRGAGEPEMGRALPKIKQTYEEMIDFIAKKVENMLRFKFWRWHLYFIFVSSGVEYCSRKDLLLANCMMKLKREIISTLKLWKKSISTLKLKISVGVLYLMASLAVLTMVGAAARSAMPDTHLPWWLLLFTLMSKPELRQSKYTIFANL